MCALEFTFWRLFIDALRRSAGAEERASSVLCDACLQGADERCAVGVLLCSPAIGIGLAFRAVEEDGGSGLATRSVLEAELGVRDILGVVERGVGGRSAAEGVWRESWEIEDRRSVSLVVVLNGFDDLRGGSAIGASGDGPESL